MSGTMPPARLTRSGCGAAAVMALALLSGCAGAPPAPAPEPPPVPARFGDAAPAIAMPRPSAAVQATWGCLGDPVLAAAVEQALQQHPDIALAAARLAQAEAVARLRQAERRPRLDASAGASRQRVPEDERVAGDADARTSSRFKATLSGRWDLDLPGRLALAASADTARWAQARAQADDNRRRVAADAALLVLQLRALQQRLQAREDSLQVQRAQQALAERRQAAGLAAATDAARERVALAQGEAVQAGLQREWRDGLQRLAQDLDLPAAVVQRWLASAADGPGSGCTLEPGLPAELLTRRPDLLAAYQGVVAAAAERGVAEAGRRPTLVLDSALGWSAVTLSGLSGGGALLASLGATLDLRLFDFGRIEAEIDRSRAAEREAWLRYRNAARLAVAEVEAALAAINTGQAAVAALDAALAQQARVAQDAGLVASAGLADPAARLAALQAHALLREQQAEARLQVQQATARLIRDLGRVP